ncbi:MAG: hypothetical protein ABIG69_14060 [Bacteroidota bacterium]
MELLKKLEEIKQIGNYAVNIMYGEDIGCDDSGVEPEERRIVLVASPVGFVGELRIMWRGIVKDFLKFDFKSKAHKISNPPERKEYEDGGFFVWGTESSTEHYLNPTN